MLFVLWLSGFFESTSEWVFTAQLEPIRSNIDVLLTQSRQCPAADPDAWGNKVVLWACRGKHTACQRVSCTCRLPNVHMLIHCHAVVHAAAQHAGRMEVYDSGCHKVAMHAVVRADLALRQGSLQRLGGRCYDRWYPASAEPASCTALCGKASCATCRSPARIL